MQQTFHPPHVPPVSFPTSSCSAGVGRSGTFIALDITLDQMAAEKTVDVKGTMQRMREKRMYMIQTVVGEQRTALKSILR